MSGDKELKLVVPKSLMAVLWVAAIGLVLNGVQLFLTTPANAVGDVQKVAICSEWGEVAPLSLGKLTNLGPHITHLRSMWTN